MNIRQFIEECKKRLSPLYPAGEISSLAARALEDIFSISRTHQLTYPEEEICLSDPEEVISRLESGEPIQYIAGFEYFCGDKFKVGPGVLIPRPETEELVNLIVEDFKKDFLPGDAGVPKSRTLESKYRGKRCLCPENHETGITFSSLQPFKIFDICTGSGCIAWSLHKLLENIVANNNIALETYGCDISETALEYVQNQRFRHGRRWPMFFRYDVLQDISRQGFAALRSFIGKLDIIVSNPPYIAEKEKSLMHKNVLDFEPEQALFVSDEDPLLFYRKIAEMAKELLYPGGKLYFEINPLFAEELKSMLQKMGLCNVLLVKDISGKFRFASASYCS